MAISLLVLAAMAGIVNSAAPSISPETDVPSWAADSTMQLSLSSAGGEVLPPLDYTVMPSTESLGLNQSERARGSINIEGIMIAATPNNYDLITGASQIAYLSCDKPEDDSIMGPDAMLAELMTNKPKAIVLYSTVGNWCMLSGDDLPYESVFTMADAGDATQAYEILNNTNEVDVIQVQIAGDTTEGSTEGGSNTGSSSAVAMSILYSITGLITLLFLVIIGTGAIRAHRYPERYGPRSGAGGRPSQSRAKGIARAVLDTIPIVKFGNPGPPKPDPETELENGSGERRDRPVDRDAHAAADEQPASLAESDGQPPRNSTVAAAVPATKRTDNQDDENLGCSICTEDFTVGEDVRLLPCNHKFHPACIDPWLVNVSGTCPLCRLDLRPGTDSSNTDGTSDETTFPPPLEADSQEAGEARRRTSRFLDLNRLRHASVEERIQTLRQFRTEQRTVEENGAGSEVAVGEQQQQEADGDSEGDARGRRAKLADKLKEKFRIRTRPQEASASSAEEGVLPMHPNPQQV